MNRTITFAPVITLVSVLLPAMAMAGGTRHSGFFGGVTYGHFAYEDRDGGTEPGWGPTFGAFGELTPFPSDLLALTIEGSYLRIGSADFHGFYIPEADPPALESRAYLSAAPLLKLMSRGRVSPYFQLGPTLNFRLPEGTSYPGAIVFGAIYGIGLAVPHGHRSFMVELRYLHHWSSSAGYTPPSRARALSFVGRVGF
jgi:hypothetical protein